LSRCTLWLLAFRSVPLSDLELGFYWGSVQWSDSLLRLDSVEWSEIVSSLDFVEWSDILHDSVERSGIVSTQIPLDGYVDTFLIVESS
jgi:hypothetical protein